MLLQSKGKNKFVISNNSLTKKAVQGQLFRSVLKKI